MPCCFFSHAVTGGLYAFGDNSDGQLGMGDSMKKPEYALCSNVPSNAKFVKVAAGPRSSAGVTGMSVDLCTNAVVSLQSLHVACWSSLLGSYQ